MIFIEFGHHASDPGAVSGKWVERDLNIEIGRMILDSIINKSSGIATAHDSPSETLSQVIARIKTLFEKESDKDISFHIHFNAATPAATGTECFIPQRHTTDETNLAKQICVDTASILGIKNRGVKGSEKSARGTLYIDQLTELNVLWEVCFITNESDMAKYTAKKKELASAIADILISAHNKINR